jgi:hypothetical protein
MKNLHVVMQLCLPVEFQMFLIEHLLQLELKKIEDFLKYLIMDHHLFVDLLKKNIRQSKTERKKNHKITKSSQSVSPFLPGQELPRRLGKKKRRWPTSRGQEMKKQNIPQNTTPGTSEAELWVENGVGWRRSAFLILDKVGNSSNGTPLLGDLELFVGE